MPRMIVLSRVYVFISQKYNEILINIEDYLSREPQLPIFNNISLTFKIVAALLGFLQLKHNSPFETHPKTVFVAVLNLVMFWVSCDAEERFTHTNRCVHMINIARHGRIMFATLLVASLTSILVPSFIQPIVYLVYIVYCGHEWIYWLYKRIMDHEVGPTDIL